MKLMRQLKQDRRAIGAKLDQNNQYGFPNQTVRFSQRKHMLKMITKTDLGHF
jgi:hypothetical protein